MEKGQTLRRSAMREKGRWDGYIETSEGRLVVGVAVHEKDWWSGHDHACAELRFSGYVSEGNWWIAGIVWQISDALWSLSSFPEL